MINFDEFIEKAKNIIGEYGYDVETIDIHSNGKQFIEFTLRKGNNYYRTISFLINVIDVNNRQIELLSDLRKIEESIFKSRMDNIIILTDGSFITRKELIERVGNNIADEIKNKDYLDYGYENEDEYLDNLVVNWLDGTNEYCVNFNYEMLFDGLQTKREAEFIIEKIYEAIYG